MPSQPATARIEKGAGCATSVRVLTTMIVIVIIVITVTTTPEEDDEVLFENEPHFRLIQLIAGIHIKTRQFTERRIKRLNMTYPQLGALMALVRKDDITQRELANLLESDTTTAMVLCDSLEKRGWLKRKRDKADRRVNRLVLTSAGRDAYGQAIALIQAGYEYVFSKTSPDELNQLLPLLDELYQHIKEVT